MVPPIFFSQAMLTQGFNLDLKYQANVSDGRAFF